MNKRSFFLILALPLFLLTHSVQAFTVILKSGKHIEGTYVGENASTILIKNKEGIVLTFKKSTLDMTAMAAESRMPYRKNKLQKGNENAELMIPETGSELSQVGEQEPQPGRMTTESDRMVPQDGRLKPTPSPLPENLQEKPWSIYVLLSSVFDSNIDHDEESLDSYGASYGVGARYAVERDDDEFLLAYEVAGHSYTETDRWNRVSHNFLGSYEYDLSKRLSLEIDGQIAIKGSAEDREIGDYYDVVPQLKYDLTRTLRIEFNAANRIRRYDNTERNATNRYAGINLLKRFGRSFIEGGYRYERNNAEGSDNDFWRPTYSVQAATPFSKKVLWNVEFKYRPKFYDSRTFEDDDDIDNDGDDDEEFLRKDKRYVISTGLNIIIQDHWEILPEYKYENRDSNEDVQDFDEHLMRLTFRYRW